MYNTILVPVSFEADRNAEGALKIADALRAEGGKISLLHVMEELPQFAMSHVPESYLEEAAVEIRASLAQMGKGFEQVDVEVVEGHSARTILEWADAHGVDCIVVASHRPGVQDYFLGSTAARVVRHAKCAVHVIR